MNESEPRAKRVLNTNTGLSNIIEGDNIDNIMNNTFVKIANVLSDHCGPYGMFAMIPSEDGLSDPKFTKDGMNIVRAMEFINPMEREVQDNLLYIAGKVERASGDGTTSSMIIVCEVLKTLQAIGTSGTTYGEYVSEYNTQGL